MTELVLIAHNLRSSHNVGSLLRTADGLGVSQVILSGYTPYPPVADKDPRLPHERAKILRSIHKTALGAEDTQPWRHTDDLPQLLHELHAAGYTIAALEQAANSVALPSYKPADKLALILGREVDGLEPEILQLCDLALEIPMRGSKESYNVVQAAAMAAYHCLLLP